jgi:glycosyltransferase involved in cell wall biosynthesis
MTGPDSTFSLIVPVYRNEKSIPELLEALVGANRALDGRLEVVFVVDGSPDRSAEILASKLPDFEVTSQLLLHSRNFGSFAAIRSGLASAQGRFFAVMAADLQEPPELVVEFFGALETGDVDVTVGTRMERDDPLRSRSSARLFWSLYRRFVQPEMPVGGIDVFGCNRAVRDRLLEFSEANSSLVGLLFWLGFRRREFPYRRRASRNEESGWTFARKVRYLFDSAFAFSDLPIRLLILAGALGLVVSLGFGAVVLMARLLDWITVPGYAAIVVTIIFFGALNTLGLGIVGSYLWRAFENTKQRPGAVVMSSTRFEGSRGSESGNE